MYKDNLLVIFNKTITYSIYIFALGIFTSKFLIYLGMGLSLIFWLLKLVLLRKKYNFIESDFLIPVSFFTFSIIISGIGNWNNEILESKFFYSFIFFFIVVNELKNKKEFKNIIKILLFSAAVAALYGLYQHYYLNMSRVNSFSFSIAFGNFMVVLILFTTVYFLLGKLSKEKKIILLFLDIIFVLNLIFTQSRGAWLACIGSLVFLGWIKGRNFLIGIILGLLILFLILPSNYTDRFMSSFDVEYNLKTNRSNSIRIALWNSSIKMFNDNPINGVGYKNFADAYREKYQIEGVRVFGHAHNNILNFAAELGVLGLSSFIYLMFVVLKKLIIYYRLSKNLNSKLFHLSSIISFTAYHIQGLTQYNFGDTEPLHFFWFMIALNIVIYNNLTGVELNEN